MFHPLIWGRGALAVLKTGVKTVHEDSKEKCCSGSQHNNMPFLISDLPSYISYLRSIRGGWLKLLGRQKLGYCVVAIYVLSKEWGYIKGFITFSFPAIKPRILQKYHKHCSSQKSGEISREGTMRRSIPRLLTLHFWCTFEFLWAVITLLKGLSNCYPHGR